MSKVTHEHVVRSAVISGGNSLSTMKEMVKLLKDNTILVPSPLRLLRLTNGLTCERGDLCQHRKNGNKPKKVNFIRPGYGVFVCWNCLTNDITAELKIGNAMLENPRILRATYGRRYYLFAEPFYDTSGERASAIVSVEELKSFNDETQAVEEHLRKMDEANVWSSKSSEIIACFETAVKDYGRRKKEQDIANEKRKNAALNKKIDRVKKVTEMVKETLPETPWKEFIFSCRYNKQISSCMVFSCGLIQTIMEQCTARPASVTKKAIKEIGREVTNDIEFIWKSNFLNFIFLSNDEETEPFEYSIRSYMERNYTPKDIMLHDQFSLTVLELLKQGRHFEAMAARFRGIYVTISSEYLSKAFAEYIVPNPLPPADDDNTMTRTGAIQLAERIWERTRVVFASKTEIINTRFRESCKEQFILCRSMYNLLYQMAVEEGISDNSQYQYDRMISEYLETLRREGSASI